MNRESYNQNIDLSGVHDRTSLHQRLRETLDLPEWYGRNLDALYDALTDAPLPVKICFTSWEELQEADPDYFDRFRRVLRDAEAVLPDSSFIFAETPGEFYVPEDGGSPKKLFVPEDTASPEEF